MNTVSASLTAKYSIKDWRKLYKLGAIKRRLQTLDFVEALDAADVNVGQTEPAQVLDNMLLAIDAPAMVAYRLAAIESAPQQDKEPLMAALMADIAHDVKWRVNHFKAMLAIEDYDADD